MKTKKEINKMIKMYFNSIEEHNELLKTTENDSKIEVYKERINNYNSAIKSLQWVLR